MITNGEIVNNKLSKFNDINYTNTGPFQSRTSPLVSKITWH